MVTPAYSVTKHGAVAFAEWLSATYRHRGIVVQAVCPQGVWTHMLDAADTRRDLLDHDGVLSPDQVADAVWHALGHDRFLVLPHPQVADYAKAKVADGDAWLAAMNRVQQRVDQAAGQS
ncbi:SDR family NAD(P)-dependent oxidoreductase [Dactylosporangium sp. CA-233914]|uniref:SDR family NAD(P)-dependent oxidoreductase n=1 Tax=Dactylosporangium sp. CA-233914 TaxID=3239934 RepID=UPI003D8F8745